jgi:alcohol dehydrogenase
MQSFSFNTVARIVSGPGEALKLAEHCASLGMSRVLLVTDPGLVGIGLIGPVQDALVAGGLEVSLFARVSEDPPESVVLAASEQGQQPAVDGVIAVGGGSSMDVAKVVAVLLAGEQQLGDMYGVDKVTGSRLPLILVPTTAGTGSEVTPVAVITTGETTKAGVVAPQLLPDLAILDAELTTGLPAAVTAATGALAKACPACMAPRSIAARASRCRPSCTAVRICVESRCRALQARESEIGFLRSFEV